MAFYKKFFAKISQRWYPRAVTWGKPISTKQLAKDIARGRTITPADTYAVLNGLSDVMSLYMAQGRTVKLDGVGTFYYSINASKNGVKTPEEVSAKQIHGARVVFIPEKEMEENGTIVRTLMQYPIVWKEWGADRYRRKKAEVEPVVGDDDDAGSGS